MPHDPIVFHLDPPECARLDTGDLAFYESHERDAAELSRRTHRPVLVCCDAPQGSPDAHCYFKATTHGNRVHIEPNQQPRKGARNVRHEREEDALTRALTALAANDHAAAVTILRKLDPLPQGFVDLIRAIEAQDKRETATAVTALEALGYVHAHLDQTATGRPRAT